jgi:hypothetical protein
MMNRGWIARGLLAALLVGGSPLAAVAAGWQEHVYQKDGFAIATPSTPKLKSKTIKTPDGKIDVHSYESDFPDADHPYQVFVSHYPAEVDEKGIIEAAKNAHLHAAQDGKISDEQDVTLDGVPGADYTVTFPELTFHVRILVVGDTTYQAIVTWRSGAEPGDVDRFIKSFRLLPK